MTKTLLLNSVALIVNLAPRRRECACHAAPPKEAFSGSCPGRPLLAGESFWMLIEYC